MLTEVACRRAAPRERGYKLTDARGLSLFVQPTGFKSWRWKFRIGGKEKRLVFGPYPEISLAQARLLREAAAGSLRQGIDPTIEKRQRREAYSVATGATFEEVARDWVASQLKSWSPRYGPSVLSSLVDNAFPIIGAIPITSITTPMVLQVLRRIEKRGSIETAHRVRQRISEVFSRAIASGIADKDPAAIAGKALSKVQKRKFPAARTLAQARDVLIKTEAEPAHPRTKLAGRLLALTAVRSGVLRAAEPTEFEGLDGDSPIWRIPAAKMKLTVERKGDPELELIVPLSKQAVETVRVALKLASGAPLIFPSVRSSRRPLSDSTLSKVYREAGFSGIHVPHGWRSTFSTIMNELAQENDRAGDRAIIDLMLAHIPQGVEAAYNRAAYMPRRRQIAQQWADLLVDGLAPPASLLEGRRQH